MLSLSLEAPAGAPVDAPAGGDLQSPQPQQQMKEGTCNNPNYQLSTMRHFKQTHPCKNLYWHYKLS